jgi:predicted nucleotidyltransferase
MSELRSRIRQYALDRGPEGATVVLYGSVENGGATADSDVDLLVVVPDNISESATEDFVYELSEHVRAWTGNPAQIIHMTTSELHESSDKADALVDTWLTDGDALVGQALSADT